MTTSPQTLQTSSPTVRLAPVVGAGLLVAALAIGGLALSRPAAAPQTRPAVALPTFDAVQFRAGEHAALAAPVFDAVQFRAGERAALGPAAGFNAIQFRAEEHAASGPAATFDAVQFRAEERSGIVQNATSASGGGRILAK